LFHIGFLTMHSGRLAAVKTARVVGNSVLTSFLVLNLLFG